MIGHGFLSRKETNDLNIKERREMYGLFKQINGRFYILPMPDYSFDFSFAATTGLEADPWGSSRSRKNLLDEWRSGEKAVEKEE